MPTPKPLDPKEIDWKRERPSFLHRWRWRLLGVGAVLLVGLGVVLVAAESASEESARSPDSKFVDLEAEVEEWGVRVLMRWKETGDDASIEGWLQRTTTERRKIILDSLRHFAQVAENRADRQRLRGAAGLDGGSAAPDEWLQLPPAKRREVMDEAMHMSITLRLLDVEDAVNEKRSRQASDALRRLEESQGRR